MGILMAMVDFKQSHNQIYALENSLWFGGQIRGMGLDMGGGWKREEARCDRQCDLTMKEPPKSQWLKATKVSLSQ